MNGAALGLTLWGLAILTGYIWWERAAEANAFLREEG